jgi:hypothetical protein
MSTSKFACIAAVLALGVFGPAPFPLDPAKAEPSISTIDCNDTEFLFKGDGYTLSCQLVEDDVKMNSTEAGGAGDIRNEIIVAVSPKDGVYLSTVSMRLIAARFGFIRGDLRQAIDQGFPQLEKADWRSAPDRDQFEIAEFRADDRQCAAWQRYGNSSGGIFKRHVFGFGCAKAGRELVYQALSYLSAPAD